MGAIMILLGFAGMVLTAVTVWCIVVILKDSGQMVYSESEYDD